MLVFLVGLFLRLYLFDSVPRGVLYDEAYNGADALRILAGWRPIFLPANYGREALFQYGQALSIALFGASDWTLRVPAILSGVLTLPASYVLLRRLYGRRVALLGSAWLSISLWHVMYSRIGLRTILLPLVLALAFYSLWRGLDRTFAVEASPTGGPRWMDRRALAWFALSGAFIGLAQYTYTTARFAPIVVLAFAAYLAVFHRAQFRRALIGFVVVGIVSFLVFAPEGWHFLRHPEDFVTRAEDVSALNPNLDSSMSLATPSGALSYSVLQSLGMFTFHGDDQWDRNIPGRPIFDPVSSVFFFLGLALLVRRAREPRAAFILIWLLIMLVPSMISLRNVPNFLRVTGLIPAVFLVPALGLDLLWRAWEERVTGVARAVPIAVVALAFGVGAVRTYSDYFGFWAHQTSVSQTFNADRWLAIVHASALARQTGATTFVGAGNADEPLQRYALAGSGSASLVRTFNGQRSLIFPVDPGPTTYVFSTRDVPAPPLIARFFGNAPSKLVAVAPDGEQVIRLELPAARPDFAPEHPLEARFGDSLQVYGFDLPRDTRAGNTLTVRWYWRIIGQDQRDLYFFNQLYDGKDRRAAVDDHAFAPGYWPIGTTGVSSFDLKVDPSLPTGAYTVLVGVYARDTMARLPVIDGLGRTAGSQITLGPIKIHGVPPSPPVAPPHSLTAHFADGIDLQGYGIQTGAQPGQFGLALYWSARARPSRDYTVFVHLLDAQGHVVAQGDAPPQGGSYPTSLWDAGETIVDAHQVKSSVPLAPGTYQLEVGLYRPDSGQRLSVIEEQGKPVADRILIPA